MAKRALGRGLSALLGDAVTPQPMNQMPTGEGPVPMGPPMLGDREALTLPLESVSGNPDQPRKAFDDNALEELAQSIRANGILQPILVRRKRPGSGTSYEVIAGERRLRAAHLAGLDVIPALVCSMEEQEAFKLALLENIQREDLNAIEEAEAYRRLMDDLGATHQEMADMLGKNRSTITNILRLLTLEEPIRELVKTEQLSMGHARCLLAVSEPTDRLSLAKEVVSSGIPVRMLEKRIQKLLGDNRPGGSGKSRRKTNSAEAVAVREFETRLEHHLGSPVSIQRRAKKGKIEIRFFSDEELERVLERLGISSQL